MVPVRARERPVRRGRAPAARSSSFAAAARRAAFTNPTLNRIPTPTPPHRAVVRGSWKGLKKRLRAGAKLIVIDPRESETARFADIHIQSLPGEDCAVLAGLLHLVLEAGWLVDYALTMVPCEDTVADAAWERFLGIRTAHAGHEYFDDPSEITPQHPEALDALGYAAISELSFDPAKLPTSTQVVLSIIVLVPVAVFAVYFLTSKAATKVKKMKDKKRLKSANKHCLSLSQIPVQNVP